MLGLIKKDILVMKHQLHRRDILIVVGLVLFLFWGLNEYAMPLMSVICLMTVSGYCNTIAICDLRTRWDEYESVLPVTILRRVLARYIVCIGMLILMLGCLFLINLFLSIIDKNINFHILIIEFMLAYVQMLIALPVSLCKGGEKSSYVLCVFLGIIAIICWGIKFWGVSIEKVIYIFRDIAKLRIWVVLLLLIGTTISYRISLRNKLTELS